MSGEPGQEARGREPGYCFASAKAAAAIETGRTPVVDASWYRRFRREWLYEAALYANASLLLIYVSCNDLTEIRRRLTLRAVRQDGVDDIADSMDVYHHIDREFEEPHPSEIPHGLELRLLRVETGRTAQVA